VNETEYIEAEAPTHYLGICDECRNIKTFTSAHARDLWMNHHPHQEA
jgi:hypothetical protein